MGGLSNARRAFAAAAIVGAATFALAGCENALLAYLFKGILYQGWKVTSWSTPAPVVAGETHELGKSNGSPMNMAMGTNGMLHLVGWKVNDFDWVYTSMAPGAAQFDQAFTIVNSTPNPDEMGRSPGIDLVTDDTPIIAYGVGGSDANHYLYYQGYNAGSGTWGSAQTIVSNTASVKYAPVFACFFASDFKSHLWYAADGKLYHIITSATSPEEWLPDIGKVAAVRSGASDAAFAYTDSANTQLFYRAWSEAASTPVWTAPADTRIRELALTRDSSGAVYVCFGTSKSSDPMNTAYFALHLLSNAGGTWRELEPITGNASSGPMPQYPCSLTIVTDRYGNNRLHMVYTIWTPPLLLSVWYTYYDETGWSPPRNLDSLHNAILPQIAVDPAGTVHVVYSWYSNELNRTMMYVRGTPGEPQTQ